MSALTSLLVRDGVVPVRKIEQAIQRQVISGGEIETVLLEMDALPENVLAGYLATVYELLPATREEVSSVTPDVISLVPKEVAIEHRVVPLRVEGRTLHIAVHEPLSPKQEEQLGFLLGFELVPHIACEVRVAAGLALHYGADLTPRMLRLIDKVRGRVSGELPRIGKVERGRLIGRTSEIPSKAGVESPAAYRPSSRSGSFILEPAPPESVPPPPLDPESDKPSRIPTFGSLRRLRGPMTLAAGERLLKRAVDRDQILEVLFAFGRQFFDYTVLFVVQDGMADGREAYGVGAPQEEVRRVSISLSKPSAFSEVLRTRVPHVRRLNQTETDRDISLGLRRPGNPPAFVMPVAIRQRVVVILYGDRDGEDFDIGAAMELVRFGPRVVEAFEQLIIRKKRAGYHRETEPEEPTPAEERASLKEAAKTMADRALDIPIEGGAWMPSKRSSPGFRPSEVAPTGGDSWGSVEHAPEKVRPKAARISRDTIPDMPATPDPSDARSSDARVAAEPIAEPVVAEPIAAEPVAAEPVVAEPVAAEPVAAEPVAAEPGPREASEPRKAPRRARRAPSQVLGIPRRAPPPPPPSAEFDLSHVLGAIEDDEPEVSFDAGEEAVEIDYGDDDSEYEVTVDYGDEETDEDESDEDESDDAVVTIDYGDDDAESEVDHASAPSGRPVGEYSLRQAPVDVIRPARRGHRPRPRGARDTRRDEDEDGDPGAVRASPSSKPPRGLDASTRSVIVDMGDQVHAQVEGLLAAPSEAEQDRFIQGLLTIGEAALPALAQAFPGPLTWTRASGGRLPRAGQLSPVARALVAFGPRAAGYVAALLSSAHPDVRLYASVVASEMVSIDLMDAVAERVHDGDPAVRHVAVQLLPRFAGFRGFDEIRTVLRRTARIRGKDLTRRWQAVDALGALRDVEMIPKFIELLREDDGELVAHLHRALVGLTSADFGHSHRRWTAWWNRNRSRHRIEWLIDGLSHGEESIRHAAATELKALTQEYYGYNASAPKRERERVAQKYRAWWDRQGYDRFV